MFGLQSPFGRAETDHNVLSLLAGRLFTAIASIIRSFLIHTIYTETETGRRTFGSDIAMWSRVRGAVKLPLTPSDFSLSIIRVETTKYLFVVQDKGGDVILVDPLV